MNEIELLITGIIFGLSAGMSPGPLMTLVISETLQHGKNAGFRVSLAPLITDIPIILVSVFLLSKIPNIDFVLGLLSLLGALFVGYLAFESIRIKGFEIAVQKTGANPIKKGIVTNLLNPHPYIFFFSVGAPIILLALAHSAIAPLFFIAGFLGCLVGSKIALTLIVDSSRSFLTSNTYLWIQRMLGVVLLFFAFSFLGKGLELLRIFT